jgi:cytoskeletal protein CcmA (bactofilin family)
VSDKTSGGRRPSVKPLSILASDLEVEGNLAGDGELLIEGAVRGDVAVTHLVVGEHAKVTGRLSGEVIDVRGEVTGDIKARCVRLWASARVEGDILHEELSIEAGAIFQGRCQRLAPPGPAPALSAALEPALETDPGSKAGHWESVRLPAL